MCGGLRGGVKVQGETEISRGVPPDFNEVTCEKNVRLSEGTMPAAVRADEPRRECRYCPVPGGAD